VRIIIYSPRSNNRIRYTIGHIFDNYFDSEWYITESRAEFESSKDQLKINYSGERFSDSFNVLRTDYMNDFDVCNTPAFAERLEYRDKQTNFDPIAAIFFFLSRAEEYRDFNPDEHGRFCASHSVLAEQNLCETPLVDKWIQSLRLILQKHFNVHLNDPVGYRFISTVDIDHIFAFRAKALPIYMASLARDIITLRLRRVADRFRANDPYDQFEYLSKLFRSLGIESRWFIMCAKRGAYDKIISYRNPAYQDRVKSLASDFDLGIHPSYASNSNPELISSERLALESVIGRPVGISRQHYLRMSLPDTYKALIKSGIREDYSMAFHDRVGFRASTCRPFYWFDVMADNFTELKIIPFQVMDITLRKYMDLDPGGAFSKTAAIVDTVRDVNGTFVLLWHNSSFYEEEGWGGYSELYTRILNYAKS